LQNNFFKKNCKNLKKKKKRNGDLENCIIVNSETLKGRTKGRERRDDCF
jgi:hypothetical protein